MNTNKIKTDRSVAMREGNALIKTAALSRSTALKQGYKVAQVLALFAAGVAANITFTKADGSVRTAIALPAKVGSNLVNGRGKTSTHTENMLFMDAEINEFRTFKKANLLTVTA